jgi:hypothetical protein
VAETLEARIDRFPPGIPRVTIAAICIALPDLDAHTGKRMPVAIEQSAMQIADVTTSRLLLAADPCQVIVIIQWQGGRVEGAGSLTRGYQ